MAAESDINILSLQRTSPALPSTSSQVAKMDNKNQTRNAGASEAHEATMAIPRHPGSPEAPADLYPPSRLLWAPVGPPGRASDHTITVPEPHICRICDPDEEVEDDVLVELGCSCEGQMSRMHRKCILEWYGMRMLLDKNFKCELCNTILHSAAQLVVMRGVTDYENGGRAIIMKAVKLALSPFAAHMEVERAATYQELVHILHVENTAWFSLWHQIINRVNANNNRAMAQTRRFGVSLLVMLAVIAVAVIVGVYAYLSHHFYGHSAAFH